MEISWVKLTFGITDWMTGKRQVRKGIPKWIVGRHSPAVIVGW